MEPVHARAEGVFIEQVFRQYCVLGAFESAYQIVSDSLKPFISCAPSKEHATVSNGCQSGILKQRDKPTPDIRIITQPLIRTRIRLPKGGETLRLRPRTKIVMIIIEDKYSPARTNRTHHLGDDLCRAGNMLQKKAGMRNVERSHLRPTQGKLQSIPIAELHKLRFS